MAEQEELKLIISAEFANENEFDRVQREIQELERKVRDAKGRFKRGGALSLVEKDELSRLKGVKVELNNLVKREQNLRAAIEGTTKAEVDFEKASRNAGRTRTETAKRVRQENVTLAKQARARLDDIRNEKRELKQLLEARDTSPRERDERGRFKKIDRRPDRRFVFLLEKEKQLTQELEKARQGIRREDAKIAEFKADQVRQAQLLIQAERQIVATADRRFASERKKLTSEEGSLVRLEQEQSLRRASLRLARAEQALAKDRLALPGERLSPVARLGVETEFNAAQADLARVVKNSNKQVKKQNEFFNRLKGTIRGVVVGLVVYRGLTRSVDALRFGLRNVIQFGNELENANLSVAGLIAGASDIANSQGVLTNGAEKYAAALQISKNEITEIRKQALGTTATFEQLLTIYQQNVSQALGAGLDLSQFREVALLFSQGATLLGVPQTQLAEEIRSVLQGTVRPRDTRIATALGITNADIRNAKEAGKLFEFIQEKFSGISNAAGALSTTLPVIVSDLQDGLQIAGAQGAQELRDELVRVGNDIRRNLISDEGQNTFSAFVNRILEPLTELTGVFEEVQRPLGTLLALAVTLIGEFAQSIGLVLLPFQDVLRVVNLVAAAFLGVTQILQAIFGNAFVQTALRIVGTTTVVTAAIQGLQVALSALLARGSLLAITSTFGGITTVFNGLSAVVKKLTFGTVALNGKLFLTVGALVALAIALDEVNQRTGVLSKSLGAIERAYLGLKGFAEGGVAGFVRSTAQVKQLEKLEEQLFALRKAQETLNQEQDKGSTKALQARTAIISLNKSIETLAQDLTVAGLGTSANELLAVFDFAGRGSLIDSVTGGVNRLLAGITGQFGEAGEAAGSLFSAGAVDKLLTREQYQKQVREFRRTVENELLAIESEASGSLLSPAIRFLADQKNEALKIDEQLIQRQQELRLELNKNNLTVEKRNALNAQLDKINADLTTGELARNALLRSQLRLLQAQADVRTTEDLDTQEKLAALDPRGAGIQRQREILSAQSSIRENLLEQAQVRARINQTLKDQNTLQQQLARGGITQVALQFTVYNRLLEQDRQRLRILELRAEQERLAIERAETLENLGPKTRGLALAIESITGSLTTENITRNLVQGSFQALRNGIQNAATTALQAAFTGEDVDFELLARRLGQDLANQFVNAVIDKFLFQPLLNGLSELFGLELFNNIALEANTVALTTLTAAVSASSGLSAGVAAASSAGFGAFPGAATKALGGPITAGAHTGPGAVSSTLALPSAPHNGDPRDTIPAFLRPGEYVATPEMEQRAPGLFYALEKLRRGVHGLPNFGSLRNAPKGFATGGPASGTLRTADQLASSNQGTAVLPVLVTDERSMRRIHDNPQFVAGINKRTNQQALRMLNKRPMR